MDRVYLETSFFSACVDSRETVRSRAWRESSLDWWQNRRSSYACCISPEVVGELSAPGFVHRDAALAMVGELDILEISAEVLALADLFVRNKAMPGPANAGDAVHVAVSAVHRVDFLLSWNVKHLANPRKRTHVAILCVRAGLNSPSIVTPDML